MAIIHKETRIMPFFSIIIPVYNMEKYLLECVGAILKQSFTDYEVILVDDGSTDRSPAMCDQLALNDTRFRVIHKKNEGLLMARRSGLKIASGKYIIHCDSDDYFSDEILSKLFKVLSKEDFDMVMYGYEVVDDSGSILEKHFNEFEDGTVFGDKERLINRLVSTTWINSIWSKTYKRDISDTDVDYSGYKEISMGEDVLQVVPLIEKAENIVYIAEPLYRYRNNAQGMSKNYKVEYLYFYFTVSKRLARLCEVCNASEKTMGDFFSKYEHDVNKYLLRFIKQGLSYAKYKNIYCDVQRDELIIRSRLYRTNMRKSNAYLRQLVKPQMYIISKALTKTIMKKVLR